MRDEIVNGCEKQALRNGPWTQTTLRNQSGPSDQVPVLSVGYGDPFNTFNREVEVDHALMESEAQSTETNAEIDNTINTGVHQTEGRKEEEQPQAAINSNPQASFRPPSMTPPRGQPNPSGLPRQNGPPQQNPPPNNYGAPPIM